jgi:rhodanese-related sulfurtransferase
MNWKRTFLEASALVAAAALLGAIANLARSSDRRLAWIGTYADPESGGETATGAAPKAATAPGTTSSGAGAGAVPGGAPPPKDPGLLYLEISGPVVERMHRAGALFLDARRTAEYRRGHIPGARSIPIWEHDADARIAALAGAGVPIDRVVVTYCAGADCRDSKLLAEKLAQAGFFNVYVYGGGMPEWERENRPTRSGEAP